MTNDKLPRATNPDGTVKIELDWYTGTTIIRQGASIRTGTIILPDIEVGKFALIGAGSLVTKEVPDQALIYGIPGKIQGYVCRCGQILTRNNTKPNIMKCKECKTLKLW